MRVLEGFLRVAEGGLAVSRDGRAAEDGPGFSSSGFFPRSVSSRRGRTSTPALSHSSLLGRRLFGQRCASGSHLLHFQPLACRPLRSVGASGPPLGPRGGPARGPLGRTPASFSAVEAQSAFTFRDAPHLGCPPHISPGISKRACVDASRMNQSHRG